MDRDPRHDPQEGDSLLLHHSALTVMDRHRHDVRFTVNGGAPAWCSVNRWRERVAKADVIAVEGVAL